MPRRQFKLARQINKLKAIEAAARLGISQPTLSAWEGERKSPGLDNLENMADFYGVTTDFLLGRTDRLQNASTEPISCDTHLREELRGWYRLKSRWAENEYGNRFYLDTYGAKWLAFDQKT